MSFKKNWFDYIIGTVISVVLCIILATYLNAQCVLYQFGKYETVFTVCVVFAVIYIAYRIVNCCFQKWSVHFSRISGRSKMLWEIFLVLSFFSGAVLIRFYWYLHNFTALYGTKEFYEAAMVREGMEIPAMVHGASYLYTGVLSVLFSLFGNRQFIGIVFQVMLQLMGSLLLYFAVRTLLGRAEALICMVPISFLPASVQIGFTLTPQNLYYFLFAGVLFFLSCCWKAFQNPQTGGAGRFLLPFLAGLFTGYMVYLDITGILLFIAAFFLLSGRGEKKRNLSAAVILTVAGLFSVMFFFLFQSFFNGNTLIKTMSAWLALYFPASVSYKIAAPDITIAGTIAVCTGSAWYVIGFWSKKRERGSLYAVSVLLLLALVFFTEPVMDLRLLTLFYWSVLAAAGIADMLGIEGRSPLEQKCGCGQRTKKAGNMKKEKNVETAAKRENDFEIEDMEKQDETDGRKAVSTVGKESVKADAEYRNKIRFIENPLPLPKKHVKKTMDYRFEPEEEGMKYDIETAENDDFDLK